MSKITISGSTGKGEADYTVEGVSGQSYTYFPLPGGGYEYDYAMYQGARINSYPVVIVFQAVDTELKVFYRAIEKPPVQPPPPQDETVMETVGASCKIMKHYFDFGSFYYLRHDVKGALTAYDSDINDIRDRVKDFPICNIPVKTPDSVYDDLIQKLTSGLSSLSKEISNQMGAVQKAITGLSDQIADINKSLFDIGRFLGAIDQWFIEKFDSMKDTVISWIVDAFIDIIEKVLDREVK